jgi:DNA recombination protein RmuC
VALLRAVAYGWQQDAVAENARQIAESGRELYDRLARFVEHFEQVGRKINAAGEAYDGAVGSLETRLLPTARALRDLHATTEEPIDAPRKLRVETRPVVATELKP